MSAPESCASQCGGDDAQVAVLGDPDWVPHHVAVACRERREHDRRTGVGSDERLSRDSAPNRCQRETGRPEQGLQHVRDIDPRLAIRGRCHGASGRRRGREILEPGQHAAEQGVAQHIVHNHVAHGEDEAANGLTDTQPKLSVIDCQSRQVIGWSIGPLPPAN